jgi:RND superfamily putative drug exporter
MAEDDAFGPSEVQTSSDGDVAVVSAPTSGAASDPEPVRALRDVRDDYVPAAFDGVAAEVFVTGETAKNVDWFETMEEWLPIAIAFVLALTFVLLTLAFRSVVVALKAIVLNLLSVGAAYGLLVLVFVKGYGADLLGFQQVDSIVAWVPLFLFSILFGLSMDYHVFLLSRIRERFAETGNNAESVEYGLRSTARLITGAALIIIVVFVGFSTGDLVMFQQMGFGIAIALFIDATLIRSVLVPAAMVLLGRWNWYLPSWLRWLPELEVESGRGRA